MWFEDHPRGCGEHVDGLRAGPGGAGSSPRMRGAHTSFPLSSPLERIIPADAGSTHHPTRGCSLGGDHPRGCGEHFILFVYDSLVPGSSPRMRGAQGGFRVEDERLGIIPADAGSTDSYDTALSPNQDHPRGCGEHLSDD